MPIPIFQELASSGAGASLGKFAALTADNGLSFLGAVFTEGSIIDHVRITTGNAALGPNDGGGVDVVAMGDFTYGELAVVPEPSSAALLGIGLGGLAAFYRRRRKQAESAGTRTSF